MNKTKREIEIEQLEADVAAARKKWPKHFAKHDAEVKKASRKNLANAIREAAKHLNVD